MRSRRTFLRSCSALLPLALLDACSNQNADQTISPIPISTLPLAAWGDSLTQGAGGTPYPEQLAIALKREVRNFGIGGQLATQIAARQGGLPVSLTLQNNALAGAALVNVTAISIPLLSTPATTIPMYLKGTLAGVSCILTRTATGSVPNQLELYSLTPTIASLAAIPANSLFIPDDAVANRNLTQLLWLGRNNAPDFSSVGASIQAMVAYLNKPKQFVVIGVLNGLQETVGTSFYNAIATFNQQLATTYIDYFVPSTPPTELELSAINYTPTIQDKTDMIHGTFPTGLRADNIHLNSLGYQVMANRVATFLQAKRW